MTQSSADKDHEASALRRQKAKAEGDFPRSFELAVALQVIGFTILGFLCLESISHHLWVATARGLLIDSAQWSNADARAVDALEMFRRAVQAITPLLLGCWLVVVASHWGQTGATWLPNKVVAEFGRVSPQHWWRRLVSMSTWSYLFVGLPKFFLAFSVAVVSFWCQRATIFTIPFRPVDQMGQQIASVLMQITFHVGLVLLVSSTLDYWMHYLGFEKRIRMTDQELRDEIRMQNGDPTVNAQRKSLQSSFHRG